MKTNGVKVTGQHLAPAGNRKRVKLYWDLPRYAITVISIAAPNAKPLIATISRAGRNLSIRRA